MFRLRTGYFICGIATGLILLFSFLISLPDGKLHIVFCDVGQGDAVYVRFADGRDMLVDGGPNDSVLRCLGAYMPFWDRHIDMVLMTHPQKDHMQGLLAVLERYRVDYFVRTDVPNTTEGYAKLMSLLEAKQIPIKYVTAGEQIRVASTTLSFVWPSDAQVAKGERSELVSEARTQEVLGAAVGDLNDYSLVFWLRYGSFDALFTGDADIRVESNYANSRLADESVEVLKVPHHGSRTGMSDSFIQWIKPKLSVISVGKNNYGHPTSEALQFLQSVSTRIVRTDNEGDIHVVSDGRAWYVAQ